jgi:hypothetical protein
MSLTPSVSETKSNPDFVSVLQRLRQKRAFLIPTQLKKDWPIRRLSGEKT